MYRVKLRKTCTNEGFAAAPPSFIAEDIARPPLHPLHRQVLATDLPSTSMHSPDYAALAWLLGEMSPAEFLAKYWDRQPLFIRAPTAEGGDEPSPPFDNLLRIDDMDELLMRQALPGSMAEMLFFQNLRNVDEQYVTPHAAFASGASIIVNHADKVWPPANALCASLGRALRYTFANLYFTPAGCQTAPPHSDDRDVFILHLHGRKHWRVWPTPHELAVQRPFADEQAGKDASQPLLRPEALGAPLVDVALAPGDLLYIPRGALHVALADASDCSLHLTVAVPTADLCLGGLVLNAAKATCFEQRAFRRALPLGGLPGAATLSTAAAAVPSGSESARRSARHPRLVSAKLCPADGDGEVGRRKLAVRICLRAVRDEEGAAPSAAAAAAAAAAGERSHRWRSLHAELWSQLHASIRPASAPRAALEKRMANHRTVQRDALADVEASLDAMEAAGEFRRVLSLRASTRCCKVVPLELIKPEGERGDWRVAQATPLPGGPGRLAYIHMAPELLNAFEAFAAWPLGHEYCLADLPVPHTFIAVCATRALLGLDVLEILPVDAGDDDDDEAAEAAEVLG